MNNSTRTILTLVTGAVAGAVTALLLAPQTGTETRRALGRTARRAKDQIGDTIQQGLDRISNLTGMGAGEHEEGAGMDEMLGTPGSAPSTGRRTTSRTGGTGMMGGTPGMGGTTGMGGSNLGGTTGRSGQGSIGNV